LKTRNHATSRSNVPFFCNRATDDEKVVNLELSLKVGDHLGGHTTSGHVDGTARITSVLPHPDGSQCLWIDLSPVLSKEDISKHVIYKGSICLDGVSLTVAEIKEQQIRVSLIPHTLSHTNLQYRKIGDVINIEFDQALKLLQAPAATEGKI
jgi:riboflavin synthase